ncbi:AAA family ATPase [Enterococcus saccharolyticus]|uniref:AAA family ATPase n=1 Tax=Enterococcus saccharolyticus TaxID=41997 RepID=UPI001E40F49D|nr:AAA family ATPase [Enterococcus saccharolyticus]MCD5001213.1 AAA family ATPase [Enterococcus saccharolyticus]
MTKILIDEISLKNFKGFDDFTLTLNGNNAVVSGQNGAGKTSLADGFQWLLFGKDSHGAKLNPKPLDVNNQEKQGLAPTVEAQLIIDGQAVTLTRIQEERWTTKRGELEATRASDTTKYFIDCVPVKEKEWKAYLEKLGGETQLQMLSNSAFFMSLNWSKRREILMEMSGVTDDTILANNPNLQELQSALGDHTIDELKKILAGQKKSIKQEIDGIPARIQENTDTIKSIEERIGDVIKLEAQLATHTAALEKAEDKLAIIKNSDASLDAQNELAQLKLQLTEEQRKFMSSEHLATQSLQADADELDRKLREARAEVSEVEFELSKLERAIESKEEYRNQMIAEYKHINSLTFDEHAKDCPTCGQELPTQHIDQLREKFNQEKSQRLEENIANVKAAGATKEVMAGDYARRDVTKRDLSNAKKDVDKYTKKVDEIYAELNYEKGRQGKFEDSKEYKKISEQIKTAEIKIANAKEDSSEQIFEAEQEVSRLRGLVADVQASLNESKMIDQLNERIDALKQKDRELKAQNQDVERKLWLIDEFTRTKVSSIEESINEKFDLIKWKLFDVQKNGAINEMCEATYNGVEYNSGLNNGARINSDLDIVNTLSNQFGLFMPVFIDNAESVNVLQQIDSQMIELQVTEDKKLEVEV